MAVAHRDAQGFRAGDRAFEVLDEDIVVARGLHLGKCETRLFGAHVIDVHQFRVRLRVAAGDDIRRGGRRVERGEQRNAARERVAVQGDVVVNGGVHQSAGVDDKAQRAALKQPERLIALPDVADLLDVDAEAADGRGRLPRGIEFEAEIVELLCERHDLELVVRVNADEHTHVAPRTGTAQRHARGGDALEQRLVERLAEAEHLAGGLHFRPEVRVGVGEFFEREHRNFDGVVRRRAVQPRAVAELAQRRADHDAGREVDHRNARHLAEIRHGARRARVDLNDIQLVVPDEILDVDEPLRAERQRQLARALDDAVHHLVVEVVRRIDGDGVARVHARALDVFHHAGHQHVDAVGDDVDLKLRAAHVFVHKHRVLDALREDALHVQPHLVRVVDDLHVLAADDVRRAQQHRIAEALRGGEGFVERLDAHALRAADTEFSEQFIEALAVLGLIDGIGRRAEDGDAVVVQEVRQLDGCLAAERDDNAHGILHAEDLHDIFTGQRFKVQAVCGVVVRGDRLGVVVDDDDVVPHLLERPDAVDGGVIKLDALPDADGAGAEHDDDRLARARKRARLAHAVAARVEIRRARVKFRGAGVNHLVDGMAFRQRVAAGDAFQRGVCVAERASLFDALIVETARGLFLKLRETEQFLEEPAVNACDLVQFVDRHARFERLEQSEQALVVDAFHALGERRIVRGGGVQRVETDLRAAHGFQKRHLEGRADGHDFARGFHLRAELAARADELVERPLRQLDDDVVERGLEARTGAARDVVRDLIERVAERNFGCDLGDGIARRLGRERRRARHTRVDLNDSVLKAVGIQRKLAVAAADDVERRDDVQRRGAQHLIFLVGQRLRGRNDDGVARVHADGVKVFHRADGDDVSGAVAHRLKLDFFPSEDVLLDEDLRDGRRVKTAARHFAQLVLGVRDAAARAAQCERRANNDGIPDACGDHEGRVEIFRDVRRDARLADGFHRVLEELTVLGFVDGFGVCADEPHAVRGKEALLVELHADRQTRLAAETGEQAVRFFLFNDALHRLGGERLEVDFVRERVVRHDRGGV